MSAKKSLSQTEQDIFDSHPNLGARVLSNIPGLEPIANIVKRRHSPYSSNANSSAEISANVLRVALDFVGLVSLGYRECDAITKLEEANGRYSPEVIESLKAIKFGQSAADQSILIGVG